MFVRSNRGFQQMHSGPEAGGRFWALNGYNDLPSHSEEMSVGEAFGDYIVYMQDAERADGWHIIEELPEFSIRHIDDIDGCRVVGVVEPFMPEFYLVPRFAPCGACDGAGVLAAGSDDVICPICNGNGKEAQ